MNSETVLLAAKQPEASKEIFKPASWLNTIDFINHLLPGNNILVSILAQRSGGKTSFAHLLNGSLNSRITPYLITASPLFDRDLFLAQIATWLNYSEEVTSFANFIALSKKNKTQIMFLIDDAQYLPESFVEEILGSLHQQGDNSYVHVCLFSDFSLVTALNNLVVSEYKDMVHSIELGPLSENEMKSYIQRRLSLQSGIETISDERITQFYDLTKGNMGEINAKMSAFFIRSTMPSNMDKSLRRGSMVAAVVIAVMGVTYFWQPQDEQIVSPVALIDELPRPEISPASSSKDIVSLDSEIPSYQIAAVRQMLQSVPLRRVEVAAYNEDEQVSDDSMVVMDKVVVIPKVIQKHATQEAEVIKKISQTMPHEIAKKTVKAKIINAAVGQTRYTIQILASHNITELKRFVQLHHLSGKTKILRGQHQGMPWYVLAFGEYAQRDMAKQAVNQLPKELTKLNPWVRPISDLKKAG